MRCVLILHFYFKIFKFKRFRFPVPSPPFLEGFSSIQTYNMYSLLWHHNIHCSVSMKRKQWAHNWTAFFCFFFCFLDCHSVMADFCALVILLNSALNWLHTFTDTHTHDEKRNKEKKNQPPHRLPSLMTWHSKHCVCTMQKISFFSQFIFSRVIWVYIRGRDNSTKLVHCVRFSKSMRKMWKCALCVSLSHLLSFVLCSLFLSHAEIP